MSKLITTYIATREDDVPASQPLKDKLARALGVSLDGIPFRQPSKQTRGAIVLSMGGHPHEGDPYPDRRTHRGSPIGTWWRTREHVPQTVVVGPCVAGLSASVTDIADARRVIYTELIIGTGHLRAWHFLECPSVLAVLSAAVSPYAPRAGAAVILWLREAHAARVASRRLPFGGATEEYVPAWLDVSFRNIIRVLAHPDGLAGLAASWGIPPTHLREAPPWPYSYTSATLGHAIGRYYAEGVL